MGGTLFILRLFFSSPLYDLKNGASIKDREEAESFLHDVLPHSKRVHIEPTGDFAMTLTSWQFFFAVAFTLKEWTVWKYFFSTFPSHLLCIVPTCRGLNTRSASICFANVPEWLILEQQRILYHFNAGPLLPDQTILESSYNVDAMPPRMTTNSCLHIINHALIIIVNK